VLPSAGSRQHTTWTFALDQLQAVDLYGAPVGGASALLIERVCTGTADLFFQVCVLPSHGWRRRCRFCDVCGNQIADMANSAASAPPHLLARVPSRILAAAATSNWQTHHCSR